MKPQTRLALKEFVFTMGSWLLLSYFYYFIVFWGPLDFAKEGMIKDYVGGGAAHVELLSQGVLFGSFLALINLITERTALRKRSFGQIILIKSVLYLAAMALAAGLVYVLFVAFVPMPKETLHTIWLTLPARFYLSTGVYLTFAIFAINFVLEVRRKFGPGNLWHLITGRYHQPKVERRIFLFLDMKGSTTIAEQLGHRVYSRFIRHCYHDLTDLVLRYDARIYQYVGDEVVLSWDAERVGAYEQSLRTFFAFERRLAQRHSDYQAHFGVTPAFRGGIDTGLVTAAEVGDIKREIAYHGDVLNTAARLQELCKTYGENLLISERVNEAVAPDAHFATRLRGDVALRGKTETIGVYSIVLNENGIPS